MQFYARITKDGSGQLLCEHLKNVAKGASDRLPDSLSLVGYYAGLWHDLGKYRLPWQKYLDRKVRGEKVKIIPHSAHGAWLALEQWENPDTIPAIAFVIAGHHVGLRDPEHLNSERFEEFAEGWEEAIANAKTEIPDLIPEKLPDIDLPPLRREFAIRMLFSALVDSDRFDAFQSSISQEYRHNKEFDFALYSNSFNPHLLANLTRKIDRLRNVFARHCIAKAEGKKGFYRLTGACGIGKTKSSLRFALIHCQCHQMKGILYVGPLKVIIEQTARVYRELLREENVLEHHSGYEPKEDEGAIYKLDTERWDKPYIVTSGVQFYESLFSSKPGKCRKLYNIRDRVILIDEAQTIPVNLAKPILDVLNTLVEDWGCTIVLMSATQPAFDRLKACPEAIDIVEPEETKQQFAELNRVTYRVSFDRDWTWEDLAKDIEKSGLSQTLTVVNTTKLAQEGFQELRDRIGGDWFHLSARMCPAHRTKVLDEVKYRLNNNLPCHLISTQVVEAGVDIDFPRVYRQLAPLDSIIQTAGRCNREGKLDPKDAIATVFKMPGSICDRDYNLKIVITQSLLENPNALGDNILDTIRQYFQSIYTEMRAGGDEIQKSRQNYNFPKTDSLFQIVEDDIAVSALVSWGEGVNLLEALQNKDSLSQPDWRRVQPYCASVPRNCLDRGIAIALDNGLVVWKGEYGEWVGCQQP